MIDILAVPFLSVDISITTVIDIDDKKRKSMSPARQAATEAP